MKHKIFPKKYFPGNNKHGIGLFCCIFHGFIIYYIWYNKKVGNKSESEDSSFNNRFLCVPLFYGGKMNSIYMNIALQQAKKADKCGDIPVGAIIVKENKIISKAYNQREKTKNVINHAEIIAIRKACRKLNDWRLNGCTLFVTLEPCQMCLGAAKQARIEKIVYATSSDKKDTFDCDLSLISIDNQKIKAEATMLLKDFFKNKRR